MLDVNNLWIMILIVLTINFISGIFLYLALKVRGRPKPLLMVADTMRIMYWATFKSGNHYNLEELENSHIWYVDWHRGIGYGYMDEPLNNGDKLYVRDGKRHMILCVFRVSYPTPDKKLFIFRSFYLGKTDAKPKVKPVAPVDMAKANGFQRYD